MLSSPLFDLHSPKSKPTKHRAVVSTGPLYCHRRHSRAVTGAVVSVASAQPSSKKLQPSSAVVDVFPAIAFSRPSSKKLQPSLAIFDSSSTSPTLASRHCSRSPALQVENWKWWNLDKKRLS
nr:hypothetical protein Iba_chr09bCG13950 [Ipomoea batatas]